MLGVTTDVADIAALESAFAAIKKDQGAIDVLFANAGVAYFSPVSDVTPEFFDSITNVNQRGLFFTLKNAVPLLNDGGSIVVKTSVVNEMGMRAASVYAATKAAARNLVRGFANELAPRNIRVNAVAPDPSETPIFSKTGMPAESLDEMSQGMAAQIPLQRFGKPEEIATACPGSDERLLVRAGGEHVSRRERSRRRVWPPGRRCRDRTRQTPRPRHRTRSS